MMSAVPVKLVRITTAPISLRLLITGQPQFMQENGFKVVLISSDGEDWDKIPELERFEYYKVNMARKVSPLKDLKALVRLIQLFNKIKPQVVHSHTPKAGLLGMVAARLCSVPVRLHTVAGLPLMEKIGLERKILEWAEKITYVFATKIYPNSKKLAQFIASNGFCSPGKIKVLGNGSSNGIDTAYFQLTPSLKVVADQLRQKLNITGKNFVFVFIGRLVKDKGIEELVEAFTRLKNEQPHIMLLLVGPFEPELDPLGDKTMRVIQNDEAILNTGFQSDVRPYLSISNVLTFPSYREGFPNVPMQAGCFDLPSIVTDINGCNEIIENEINGLIIPAKDENELYNAMERLLTEKHLYNTIRANARKMIVDRYDQKKIWFMLSAEYGDHLQMHGIGTGVYT